MKPFPDGKRVAKSCPKCGPAHRLLIRTNSENGSQFLGCGNFPQCRHTEPIPESMKMELRGYKRLL